MNETKDNRFNGSIDEKNRQLLNVLEEGVQIEFEVRPEKEFWAVRPKPKYVIAAPSQKAAPAMLAHELLHIMIETLGFIPTYVIVQVFNNKNCRFETSHIPEWENLLGHCKMIRHFKGLGYEGNQFVTEEEKKLDTPGLLALAGVFEEKIKFHKFNNNKLPPDLISAFLGTLIVVKSDELQLEGYEKNLVDSGIIYKGLRNCDPTLFDALTGVLTGWISEERNYSNVDFYNRINAALEKLDFPIANPY